MADNLHLQVNGLDRLGQACGSVAAEFETRALKVANGNAAKFVENLARPNVPVRSGALVGSLRSSATAKQANVRVGSKVVPYGEAIHWGRKVGNVWHHKMAPNPIKGRPFLWNAKDAALQSGQLEHVYEAAVMDLVNYFF